MPNRSIIVELSADFAEEKTISEISELFSKFGLKIDMEYGKISFLQSFIIRGTISGSCLEDFNHPAILKIWTAYYY